MAKSLIDIKDECSMCCELLRCELCRQGHGIGEERHNIADMCDCQYRHMDKRLHGGD